MPFPCGLNVYITVEAITLIGLTFLAATSLIINSSMAKKRKSGSSIAKPPLAPGQQQQKAGAAASNAGGSAQQAGPGTAPPVLKDNDTRPVISPYGSPPCNVPFASPLTVPKDVLLRSPKLHAAVENQLPELPAITDDVGHILVHYLHTGTYESLKPKETEPLARQIEELRTSIRAYATARAYDLPKLMRLAEKRIEKYGEGLTLPHLLEITKDAHPMLSDSDSWFIGYLKARIRPHLEDPKSLLGSNLLDQISNILSPNRVLLRTVLEMFCERAEDRPEAPVVESPAAIAAPPSPPATPSVLQIRSRTIPRTETPPRKRSVTPWPSADEATPEPSPRLKKQMVAETTAREPILSEPVLAEPVPVKAVESRIKAAIESDIKPAVVEDITANPWAPVGAPSTPVRHARMERQDSAKYIPATPELDHIMKSIESPSGTASESEQTPIKVVRPHQPLLRQVDSGFWDFTPMEQEPAKEQLSSSVIEIEPDYVDVKTPAVHELHTEEPQQDRGTGVDTRDFATPEPVADLQTKGKAVADNVEFEPPLAPEVSSKDPLDAFPDTEADSDKPETALTDSKVLDRITEEDGEAVPAKAEEPEKTVKQLAGDLDTQTKPESDAAASNDGVPHDAEPSRPADTEAAEPVIVDPSPPAVAQPAGEPTVQDDEPVGVPLPETPKSVDAAIPGPQHLASKGADAEALKDVVLSTPERQKSWRKRLSMRVPMRFGRSG